MKKIIIFLIILILSSQSAVNAAPQNPTLPTLIDSLQVAVSELQTKVSQLETTINGLVSDLTSLFIRLADLENNGPDFEVPLSWKSVFSASSRSFTLSTTKSTGNVCKWNGIPLTQQVQVIGSAEMPGGIKVYGYGNCDLVSFSNVVNFPAVGTEIPVSLDIFWLQVKPKHVEFTITVE